MNENTKMQFATLGIVLTVSLFLIILTIIRTPPAQGYEISLYNVYPTYFWVSFSVQISALFWILLFASERRLKGDIMAMIVLEVLLSLVILLSLPLFRGYPFYGEGDIYTHIAASKEIIYHGKIPNLLVYPAIHVFIAIISELTLLSPEKISLTIIRQLLVVWYIVMMGMLSRVFYHNRDSLSIAYGLAFAVIPVFGYMTTIDYIFPSLDGFLFIFPFVHYLLFGIKPSIKRDVILVIVLLVTPFFHIEIAFFLGIAFLIALITSRISKEDQTQKIAIASLVLGIAAIFWFSQTPLWGYSINYALSAIEGLIGATPPLKGLISGVGIKRSLGDVVAVAIRTYGVAALYLFLATIYAIKLLLKERAMSFSPIYLVSSFITFILVNVFFLYFGTSIGYHVYRQIKYSIFIATLIVIGNFSLKCFHQKHMNTRTKALVILMIFSIATLAVYGVYPNPDLNIANINYQVTYSDIAGMKFFFYFRDDNFEIMEPMYRAYQTRFADYILGYDAPKRNIRWGYTENVLLPSHFGYNATKSLGSLYTRPYYILIYPPSREYYQVVFPKYQRLWRYAPADFVALYSDRTIDIVYSNLNDALKDKAYLNILLLSPNR